MIFLYESILYEWGFHKIFMWGQACINIIFSYVKVKLIKNHNDVNYFNLTWSLLNFPSHFNLLSSPNHSLWFLILFGFEIKWFQPIVSIPILGQAYLFWKIFLYTFLFLFLNELELTIGYRCRRTGRGTCLWCSRWCSSSWT